MIRIAWVILLLSALAAPAAEKIPVIIDTDIGSDVDDAFALALALASPELDIQAITTVGSQAEDRSWIVCRFLAHAGSAPIAVAYGRDAQPQLGMEGQIQYRRHPAPIFNRTQKPAKESAVELMAQKLKAQQGKTVIVALGPLTNVARLLKEQPEIKDKIARIVLMGGSIEIGYKGSGPAEPEWNIKQDVAAARAVFGSGVPLTVVPLDATAMVELDVKNRDRLFSAYTLLTFQVQNLYELWNRETPVLFDPVAVAAVFEPKYCTWKDLHLQIDDKGMTTVGKGKPNARTAIDVDRGNFVNWYVERVSSFGKSALPIPPKNISKFVEQGNFPARVHVAEDYDTDIELRWWMSGKGESKDIAPGGWRACRSVLTQDFDDLQGMTKTSYSAVVFNPVPGPPMGPNTRLSFRYKLVGTDKLRVQLYSLSKGYHRYLSLEGVPQNEWRHGAVDMTQMRRPDGSGGPLAEDERIDDIQFYVDPRAHVLIDDVVLYDASLPNEKRPFPKRILFTGWFDTGKQGKEWPGDFEIVPHEKPRTWKTARSIANDKTGEPWLRIHLRGERRLSEVNELLFKYHLTEAEKFRVELLNSRTGFSLAAELKEAKTKDWTEAVLKYPLPKKGSEKKEDVHVDEIRFLLPKGAVLMVDDLLLYEP